MVKNQSSKVMINTEERLDFLFDMIALKVNLRKPDAFRRGGLAENYDTNCGLPGISPRNLVIS